MSKGPAGHLWDSKWYVFKGRVDKGGRAGRGLPGQKLLLWARRCRGEGTELCEALDTCVRMDIPRARGRLEGVRMGEGPFIAAPLTAAGWCPGWWKPRPRRSGRHPGEGMGPIWAEGPGARL